MTRFDRTKFETARARRLRCDATLWEQKLWFHLRGAQIDGFSFRRQHPVGPYILDFYCAAAKLAIELDGDQHGMMSARAHDAARTAFLNRKGIRVIRFWNEELKENLDGVCDAVYRALQETPTRSARTFLPLKEDRNVTRSFPSLEKGGSDRPEPREGRSGEGS